MYFSRLCPSCKNVRIPEEKIVSEKGKKYYIYLCPICKHRDIERPGERPRAKIWNGSYFTDESDIETPETGP